MLTSEFVASQLNGREYRNEITTELNEKLRNSSMIVIYGQSDDLVHINEFGETDEFGCCDGHVIHLTSNGVYVAGDSQQNIASVTAKWCPEDEDGNITSSWSFETDVPHTTFNIMEDGEVYCVGLVIDANELKEFVKADQIRSIVDGMSLEQRQAMMVMMAVAMEMARVVSDGSTFNEYIPVYYDGLKKLSTTGQQMLMDGCASYDAITELYDKINGIL